MKTRTIREPKPGRAPPTKTLSIQDLRESLGKLEDLINAEGELIVTRYGKAIARIVPVDEVRSIPSRADSADRCRNSDRART